jgi:DNA adenine methylase
MNYQLFATYSSIKPQPFVKWAGGKRKLLPELTKHVPTQFETYYEPFLGAGALLFHLQPKIAFISDSNAELINCYKVLKDEPEWLANTIDSFPVNSEFYYELRAADKNEDFLNKPCLWRAARFIYLNKTCYNGLYRVNRQGEFNVPFGKYKNPSIYDIENINAVNCFLSFNSVSIEAMDFHVSLMMPGRNDFVYLDPPYDVLSDTSNFTGYTLGGFQKADQRVLKGWMDKLTARGAKVLQSNADTPFIRNLYSDYEIIEVFAKRSINSKGDKRGNVTELLIRNY